MPHPCWCSVLSFSSSSSIEGLDQFIPRCSAAVYRAWIASIVYRSLSWVRRLTSKVYCWRVVSKLWRSARQVFLRTASPHISDRLRRAHINELSVGVWRSWLSLQKVLPFVQCMMSWTWSFYSVGTMYKLNLALVVGLCGQMMVELRLLILYGISRMRWREWLQPIVEVVEAIRRMQITLKLGSFSWRFCSPWGVRLPIHSQGKSVWTLESDHPR